MRPVWETREVFGSSKFYIRRTFPLGDEVLYGLDSGVSAKVNEVVVLAVHENLHDWYPNLQVDTNRQSVTKMRKKIWQTRQVVFLNMRDYTQALQRTKNELTTRKNHMQALEATLCCVTHLGLFICEKHFTFLHDRHCIGRPFIS